MSRLIDWIILQLTWFKLWLQGYPFNSSPLFPPDEVSREWWEELSKQEGNGEQ